MSFPRQGSVCYDDLIDDLIVVINHSWTLHMQYTPYNVTSSCTFLMAENATVKGERQKEQTPSSTYAFFYSI